MSEKKETFSSQNSLFQSNFETNNITSTNNNLKELKTTHSGWVCVNYNSEYMKERLSKLKEESNILRKEITKIENKNLKEKNDLEKIILSLRDNNTILKQNYEMQKIDINNLNKENQKLIEQINKIKNEKDNLIKDRESLVSQIQELNNMINNIISPKLKTNENDLIYLQNKINELQNIIISLKSEKIRLTEDNKNKIELIKFLTKQNKKLLGEIKMKYNKDLSLIKSIEKIGIDKNINRDIYKEMIKKYDNENRTYRNKNNKTMNFTIDKEIFCFDENNDIKINERKKPFRMIKANKKSSMKELKSNFNKTICDE